MFQKEKDGKISLASNINGCEIILYESLVDQFDLTTYFILPFNTDFVLPKAKEKTYINFKEITIIPYPVRLVTNLLESKTPTFWSELRNNLIITYKDYIGVNINSTSTLSELLYKEKN